jgi:hypothetical protein
VADDQKKPDPKKEEPKKEPGELVMYCPSPGDPIKTKWRGVEFNANVPVRIFDAEHIEAARGNRQFSVGNKGPDDDNPGPPTTAMEYRGHVVDWLKTISTVDQFVAEWARDRTLRMACEVGVDDVNYLGTLIEPKLHAMRLAEGLSTNDVAAIFVKRGELEIPWRS